MALFFMKTISRACFYYDKMKTCGAFFEMDFLSAVRFCELLLIFIAKLLPSASGFHHCFVESFSWHNCCEQTV